MTEGTGSVERMVEGKKQGKKEKYTKGEKIRRKIQKIYQG